MTAVATDVPGLDLSGLSDYEIDFVAEVETAMEALGLHVVTVNGGTVSAEPVRITIEDSAGTRARLVSLDEVWGFAKSSHAECAGRGYRILRQPDGKRPKRTFPFAVEGRVEFRTGCACASRGFLKEHPGVVVFGADAGQAYAHWPVDGGGVLLIEQPEKEAPAEPDGPPRFSLTPGEKAIKRAAELRTEADEYEAKARALDVEIGELEAPMARVTAETQDAIAVLRYELNEEGNRLSDGAQRVGRAVDAVDVAKAVLREAEATLRDVERDVRERSETVKEHQRTLQAGIAAQEAKLASIEVPPRLRRLRKEQRILRDKADGLRKRSERVEQRR